MSAQPADKERIFNAALDLTDAAERWAYLQAACGQNRQLLAEIEALLRHDEEAGSFIDRPALAPPGTIDFRPVSEGPGTVIGPYKLLQKIGEGGFGVVYMAEQQQPVRRKVALKIIKPGMDTREVIARFESERQALALMDHPNIARVLDAGATESGRPYFVMELVKGVPITEYCDKNNLPTEQRLQLFLAVCHAVQHAHQKGIIHRDIKPTNVMVTLHDGKPVPKVIDFGVAKATSQQLTEKTLFTAYGQMIGTPVYMSPEQAEMSGLDIDTRSDIYSLGVLLYELLTGTTPFDGKRLRDAGFVEMQRIIREEEPPRPSTRVSTLGAALTVLSSQRSTEPGKLRQLLRGDLDLIVMKALEKERTRRYETPSSFAQDVERFLNHEAILARPQSGLYRLRKFAQRNKAAAASAAMIAAALLLGIVVSTTLAIQANSQRQLAQERLQMLAKEKEKTEEERRRAVEEARRAGAAEKKADEQTQLAIKRAKEADEARQAEAELRKNADDKRRAMEQQSNEIAGLNDKLLRSMEDQRRAIYAAEMNLVRLEAQRGNLARLRELLMQQLPGVDQEDLRGWEWTYWYRFLHRAQVVQRFEGFAYGRPDSALAVAPGGKLAALTRGDRTDWIELPSGKVVGSVPVRLRGFVNRTPLSSTGRLVEARASAPTAYWAGTNEPPPPAEFAVWEPSGEKRVMAIPPDALSHLSFVHLSQGGQRVAALGNDVSHQRAAPVCRLLIWDVGSGQLVLNQTYPRELNRLALNHDGTLALAWLCHGTGRHTDDAREVAALIDVSSGSLLGSARHNDDVDWAFLLPGGKQALVSTLGFSGANRKELLLWTVGAETPRKLTSELMPDYVKGAVSPDGTLFAVSGHTVSRIRLFDTQRGTLISTLHNEAATIESLTFTDDGERLVAASTTGEVLQWNLDQDDDLFGLRAEPINRLAGAGNSYALSSDQEWLALVTASGQLVLRARDGNQSVLSEAESSSVRTAAVTPLFSPNGRYLAYVTPETVQLFDVSQRKALWRWSIPSESLPGGARTVASMRNLVFTPDSQHLAVNSYSKAELLECATGKPRPELGTARPPTTVWNDQGSGRLLAAVVEGSSEQVKVIVQDMLSSEKIGEVSTVRLGAGRFVGSPDGQHLARVRSTDGLTEFWDFLDDRLAFKVPGDTVAFSPDGKLAAVATSAPLSLAAGATGAVRLRVLKQVTLWEVASGRQLASLSLAGNHADEICFSPDGRRLLTLHGKRPSGAGGTIPEVRLWDVVSGREIMAIPVADVNHYIWDIFFDPTGNRLTLLVFAKEVGTSGGWGSTVFDATPLSEAEDAQLIARRTVSDLLAQNPLPAAASEALAANGRLKPAVREAAQALLKRQRVDPNALATFCQDVIANAYAGDEQYRAALRCAEALAEIEPGTLRSRVLLGGTQFRAGLVQEALATLAPPPEGTATSADSDPYIYSREVLLLLAEHRLGKTVEASGRTRLPALPRFITADVESFSNSWLTRLYLEARQAVPGRFAIAPVGTTFVPDNEYLSRLFARMDANSDQRLDSTEATGSPIAREFAAADANSDGQVTQEEFIAIMRAWVESGRVRFRTPPRPSRPNYDDDLRKVIAGLERRPEDPELLNKRAWLLATFPDDALRDGKQAVADATKACELSQWRDASYIDTLAAAHAEVRDFAAAVKHEQQALELASAESRAEFESRLALYREHKPFRLPGRYQTIAGFGRSVDPLGDCEVRAENGALRIKIPGSLHHLSPRSYGTDAPRVLQRVEGDFTAEVKVTCPIQPQTSLPGASTAYHGAGLLVYADADHFFRVERNGYFRDWGREPSFGKTGRTELSSNAPTVEYWDGGQIVAQHVDWSGQQPQLPGESTWLRIERRGPMLRVLLSHDGQAWNEIQQFVTTFPAEVQLGVHAVNSSADVFEATFSNWKLTQP